MTAHDIVQRCSSLEEDDGRCKSLAEKTWARRAVVAHGVSACGAANFEEVPGRDKGTKVRSMDMRELEVDKGTKVRSMDMRELEVGLFGNALYGQARA